MLSKYNLNVKSFFKNKSKRKYFLSYILVLLCLFVFSISAFIMINTSLKEVFDNNNMLIVNTVTDSINEAFKNVDNTFKTLEMANEGKDKFEYVSMEEYTLNNEDEDIAIISESVKGYNFIEEIIITRRDRNYLITSTGAYQKSDFFDTVYNNSEYDEVFFDNILADYLNVKVIPATLYKNLSKYPSENPKSLFAFVKSYADMNIIIFVSEESFVNLSNIDLTENGVNLKIYDYNNSVIYSNTNNSYFINTKNISKDFENQIVNKGLKKYYITKSDYNNYYFVTEMSNYILISTIFTIIILLLGLIISFFYLIKKININSDEFNTVYDELMLDKEESMPSDAAEEIKKLKYEVSESRNKVDTMSDEIKNSTFLKLINSTSFYTRNRKTVDLVFEKIKDSENFFILSIETIKENNRFPKFDIDSVTGWLDKNHIEYVQVEEKIRKNLFVISLSQISDFKYVIDGLSEIFEDLRKNGVEVLASMSKTFKELNNIYDAYRDIKICRDYRGIDDKVSVLDVKKIVFGNHLSLPINFKEELTGKIMAGDEDDAKTYVKKIIDINIKNNIPLCKFEFMLRLMLSTITETISLNKKENSDVYELEQVFLSSIDNLKDNFDVYGIVNSFINFLHLTINMCDTKKNTLNRADVIKYINEHYKDDMYLEKIATEFGTTAKYFSNYFKKEFMIGFNEYLTQVRISHAKQILAETELSLAEIGLKVGYLNQATFAVAFKKTVGVPPGKYREMNKNI